MICHKSWVSIYSFKCFKTVWSGLLKSTLFSPCSYRLDRNGMLLKFLRILIRVVYFKDRKWISKTVNCISCSVVCKIVFAPNIPIFRTTLAKSREEGEEEEHRQLQRAFVFHANAINSDHINHPFHSSSNSKERARLSENCVLRVNHLLLSSFERASSRSASLIGHLHP